MATASYRGDKAGVTRHPSLKPSRRMGRQVHEDEGSLLVGDVEGLCISLGFSSPHVVLDLAVIQDQMNFSMRKTSLLSFWSR